jgi:glycerol-3-phosphate dehydrogenase
VSVSPADVEYLLRGHNHYFDPPLSQGELLGSFAGVRPLVRTRPGEPSALSREFALSASANGLLTVSGGKYTTYRRMAEVVTDAVLRGLGWPRRPSCTREFRLDGTADGLALHGPPPVAAKYLSNGARQHLLARYGRRAYDVAAILDEDPSLARPVVEGEPDLRAELVYQQRHEMALLTDDFLLRRTRLGLFHPRLRGLSVNELLGQESTGTMPRAAAPTVP